MRICSLLPSITETLFELGLGGSVVAVTHECDWPPEARTKTAVTRSRIQVEGRSSADMIDEIGRLTGTPAAEQLRLRFTRAIDRVAQPLGAELRRPRFVCLEWADPPFTCGHWTPELVRLAGGLELLGCEGQPSRRTTWEELAAADPDVLLIAPCGFTLDRTLEELPALERQPVWPHLRAVRGGRVFAADGSAYFNRPGPRLIESLHILAEVLHPDRFAGLAPANSFQRISTAGRMYG